jgi:hypothetical protein
VVPFSRAYTLTHQQVKYYLGKRKNCLSDGCGGGINGSSGGNLLMLEPSNCTEQD